MPKALHALTHGVPADAYPHRMALLFGLCATAHRIAARRAVEQAADPGRRADSLARAEDTLLALWTAREHLQRLALDLPRRLPVPGVPADAGWLRGHPLTELPADAAHADTEALSRCRLALRPWLEAHVLGGPAAQWLGHWRQTLAAGPGQAPVDTALHAWADGRPQPVQRWLHAAAAHGARWLPCRPLPAAQCTQEALRRLARQLFDDPDFVRQPRWQHETAETGCWTRFFGTAGRPMPHNAWMRWQHRIAELVALSEPDGPAVLASGALACDDGIGLAWTEMSRGLLVHAVRLAASPAGWTVDDGRVLAPTEWNFHPEGGLARALADPAWRRDECLAAVAALDPCVEASVAAESATPDGHGHA
jgi:hypothetical protein